MAFKQVSPIPVLEGGTGAVTLTDHGVLLGSGTGAVTPLAAAATGATLMGSTGADPAFTGSPSFSGSVTAATGLANTTGAVAINSGTSAFDLSVDASATTVRIATGGAAKTVTLGSTTTTSSLALKYGTSDFTLASATGTVMSALDTGEITYPLQPAFLAIVTTAAQANVSGDGTGYIIIYDTEVFDQNGDFDGTSTFTAPVTGRYAFNYALSLGGILVENAILSSAIITSNRNYIPTNMNPFPVTSGGNFSLSYSILADMDAGDTSKTQFASTGGLKVVDVISAGATDPRTWFSGKLDC